MGRIDVDWLVERHLNGVIINGGVSSEVVGSNSCFCQPRNKLLDHAHPLSCGNGRPKGIGIPEREIVSIFVAEPLFLREEIAKCGVSQCHNLCMSDQCRTGVMSCERSCLISTCLLHAEHICDSEIESLNLRLKTLDGSLEILFNPKF
jgi:hypothetical protein